MRGTGQIVAFLGLAALLAIGGCPGGMVQSRGIVPDTYIGTLACSEVALSSDGSTATYPGASIGTSVEIVDHDTFYMDDVLYTPGAVHQSMSNGSPVVETITGIDFNSNSILVRGTMDTFIGGLPVSGNETVTIRQSDSAALDVSVRAVFTVADATLTMVMTQTCQGTLTP